MAPATQNPRIAHCSMEIALEPGTFKVVLPIRIEHRHNFFDPVDSCEERCLKEMREKLDALGALSGHSARVYR